jgi:hypothetical protein
MDLLRKRVSRTEALETKLCTGPGEVVVAEGDDSLSDAALELPQSFLAPAALARSKVQFGDRLDDEEFVPDQEWAVALGHWSTACRESRCKDAGIDDKGASATRYVHSSTVRRKDSASRGVRSSIARSSMEHSGLAKASSSSSPVSLKNHALISRETCSWSCRADSVMRVLLGGAALLSHEV